MQGATMLESIRAERLDVWLEGRRSPTRRRLLEPLVEVLRKPAELESETDDPIPPLRWLLEQLADGQQLTQAGYLPKALVQDAATRFGWWEVDIHGLPQSEADLFCLAETRELSQRAGLVRRSGKKLGLTTRGGAVLSDPDLLWHTVARALVPTHPFDRATAEAALAALAGAESIGYEELGELVATIISEEGWREQRSGEPADERWVSRSMHETLNLCQSLNLLAVGGHWRDRSYGLNEVGRAVAIEALHHAATGPRSSPWG